MSTTAHDAAARALVVLYDARCNLAADMAAAPDLTAAMVEAAILKGRELDTACEDFRATYYPKKAACFVGLWTVMVTSPARRNTTTVLDLFAEYATPAKAAS